MPLTIAEVLKTSNSRTTTEVLTTSAGTAAGDKLAVFYGSDWFSLASMPEVTSSAGTPDPVRTVDAGTNVGHIKSYTIDVTTSGAKTVTIPAHVDADIFGVVLRISGSFTVDDDDGQFSATGTVSHTAPSLTTTGADRLLVCCFLACDVNTGFTDPYVHPAGMTERAQPIASPFAAMLVATQDIVAAGSSGTRTATCFQAEPYAAISLALAGPADAAALPRTLSQYGGFF
ncbi:hypothetical protein ACIBEJ_34340 [Nonomuraea sp. NPDC050790]|uniref:hypothetical protein n=1 Tax=Nonomuraea sp. NPDC050790 TaxID=3364371 RepID=UPI0037A97185